MSAECCGSILWCKGGHLFWCNRKVSDTQSHTGGCTHGCTWKVSAIVISQVLRPVCLVRCKSSMWEVVMMGVWSLAFILLCSVSILNGSVLTKAASTSTPYKLRKRDSSLPYDRWMAFSKNQSKEDVRVKREKEGRWIELTPVSSPLAATKEQMLTLGFKIASLLSCLNAHVTRC